jgi:hypothetical protein
MARDTACAYYTTYKYFVSDSIYMYIILHIHYKVEFR